MHRSHSDSHRAPWTADQTAEDLLAQIDELLAERVGAPAVVAALEHEGLEPHTAQAVVREIGGEHLPVTAEPAEDAPVCGIDAAPTRRFLRHPGRRLMLDEQRVTELTDALIARGLRPVTAAALVADLVSGQRHFIEMHRDRLRRLGLQGMVAGLLFTAFFVWTAVTSGPAGLWNLATAAVTLMLALYSTLLWRRNRTATAAPAEGA